MPLMIPDEIPNTAPESEKVVFDNLKPAAHARNWVVLHSVYVDNPRNPTRPLEIDFVILIPEYCAVICLEVKGGYYEVRNRQWYRPYSDEPEVVSPPDQAKNAMFALKNQFQDSHFHRESPLSLECAVAFTDGETPAGQSLPKSLAVLIGSSDATNPDKLTKRLADHAADRFRRISISPMAPQLAQIALDNLQSDLNPPQGTIMPETIFRSDLETLRPQLLRLTTDQLNSLKRVKLNPRCVIDGAAGTGKTVLAMELAQQRCNERETVALLCSNPHLSQRFEEWAKTHSRDNEGTVVAGTPATLPFWAFKADPILKDKHRRRLQNSPNLERSLKFGYLDDQWEQFIGETVKDLRKTGIFDYLVVDEAQNLCDPVFLKLMDALLKDGLAGGRWTMFGDFTHQDIVYPTELGRKGTDVLEDFGLYWANDRLETNCRNTEEIATKVAMLVDIEAPPRSGVYGPDVQIEYFNSPEDLENLLDNLLSNWQNANFHPGQIILLSIGIGNEFDTEREYAGWKPRNIREISEADFKYAEGVVIPGDSSLRNTLRYSDVYDFQGLESDVVILVLPITEDTVVLEGGITLPREKHLNRLLYTGMSRAKAMLVVVAHKNYQGTLESREALYRLLKPSKKP